MENREITYAIPVQELEILVTENGVLSGTPHKIQYQPYALFNTQTLNRLYQSGIVLGYRTIIEENIEKIHPHKKQLLYFSLLKHSNLECKKVAKGFEYSVFSLGIDQGIMIAKGKNDVHHGCPNE